MTGKLETTGQVRKEHRPNPTGSTGNAPPVLETLLAAAVDTISGIGPEFERHGQQAAELLRRLSEGRLHLAVLGQFKRGKSTLLNALLGEPILPVGVVPLTATPTFIQFGETPQIRIRYLGDGKTETFAGTSTEERNAYLADFVTESGNPKNRNGVAEVEIDLPSPILSGGVVLIDTPGIGSTFRHNTAATLNFLQQCDAALFLISADPPITEVELDFLRQVREKVPRLFFVLNKIDYLDDRELAEALAFYGRVLNEHFDDTDERRVFCLSAKNGVRARASEDKALWKACGMSELEAFLVDFLAEEKRHALKEAVCRRTGDLLSAVQMEADIALKAIQLPVQDLEEKIALFEVSLKKAESERRLIHDVLEGDKKRVTAFVEDQAADLRRKADAFLTAIMKGGGAHRTGGTSYSKTAIMDAWAEAIPEFFEQQQADLNERVKDYLLECLSPHEQRLAALVETLHRTAADLFQVPYRSLQPEAALDINRRPYWVLNTWNTDALPVLKSTEQRKDELVRRNVENIRWAMLQNLTRSFARFSSKVTAQLAETVAATRGAMESAHVKRTAHQGDIEAEVARMAATAEAVAALRTDFTAIC